MIHASIIVLAKNEARSIGACLEAVFRQELSEPFEVILIDCGSTDGTLEIVRRYPVELHEIPPEEFGYGQTRNLGAGLAHGRYLVNLTAHALPLGSHWLRTLLAEAEPEDVAGAYGRQVPYDWAFPMEQFFLNYMYGPRRRVQVLKKARVDMDVVWFSNVNSAIKRSLWEKYPFSESGFGTEDQEWSRRVMEAGYKIVYSPDAAVYHSHNYTLRGAFRRFFDSGRASPESYLPPGLGSTLAFAGRGLRYFAAELAFLLRSGYWRWIPYASLYELAKFSGIVAGRLSRRMGGRLHPPERSRPQG